MRATAALSVHHDVDHFMSKTSIPFYRIMWSANEDQFRDYGGDYKHDLFFSGVTRPEQSDNLRERVLLELDRLNGELGNFINARSHRITILALCLLMMSMPDIYQVQNYVL